MIGVGSGVASIAPAALFRRQLTVYALELVPQWLLPEIIAFVRRRQVPLDQIITHRFPLADAPAAFRLANSATTGKIVFAWD